MKNSNKLYKPAEFAKIVGMTKRALRHYHQLGILIPSFENKYGHKFYSEESFFEAQRILSLRFIGLSLDEIKDIQKNHKDMNESLKLQHKALEEKGNQINAIVKSIEYMQKTMEQSGEIVWENIFNAVKFSKYEMVKEMMMEYYDERAEEYDEIYEGKGPATCRPEVYAIDIENIRKFVESFGTGDIIDIACGSGYWMKFFYNKCSTFTFMDQSEQMLKECRLKAEKFGITERSRFIKSDILDYFFEEKDSFDCVLIGFLLGHFTKTQEEVFFKKLKDVLKPGAEILIIDSTWNKERSKILNKEDVVERSLNDGRTFKIYKKYFDEEDLPTLLNKYGYVILKRHKEREAYDKTAEVTVYLKPEYIGRGLGSQAVQYIENHAKNVGIHVLVASICGENLKSINLFSRNGYFKCAHYKEVGRKFDQVLDVVAYQKILDKSML